MHLKYPPHVEFSSPLLDILFILELHQEGETFNAHNSHAFPLGDRRTTLYYLGPPQFTAHLDVAYGGQPVLGNTPHADDGGGVRSVTLVVGAPDNGEHDGVFYDQQGNKAPDKPDGNIHPLSDKIQGQGEQHKEGYLQ